MTEAELSALTASLPGLIEKAEAATQGTWNTECNVKVDGREGYCEIVENGRFVIGTTNPGYDDDAAFIAAANPQTVLQLASALLQVDEKAKKQNSRINDLLYMQDILVQVLGPIGTKLWEHFQSNNTVRFHASWGPEAHKMTGEERAKFVLEMLERLPKRPTPATQETENG